MPRTGRPTFKATDKLKREVAELISCGMSRDDVALAIGCSTPTLEKYFPKEIQQGAAEKRAEVIGLLFKNARKGNVSAQKALEAMTRTSLAESEIRRREGSGSEGPAALARPLGKKEQQRQAAEKVGGIYETPEGPRLVVNNKA